METKPKITNEEAQRLFDKARTHYLVSDEWNALMDSDLMEAERNRMLTVLAEFARDMRKVKWVMAVYAMAALWGKAHPVEKSSQTG